jgi:hypothetical protein
VESETLYTHELQTCPALPEYAPRPIFYILQRLRYLKQQLVFSTFCVDCSNPASRKKACAKGFKGLLLALWVGPVLSSKQEESWERTKELCLLQLWNHWHYFGHIWLWVTYLLDNPNTKCCQQRVVTSLMSQWQALSGQYPLQQNMGAAHSIAMFHYIVIKNDEMVFNLFASSD